MIFTDEEFKSLSLRECLLKKAGEEGLRLARDYESTCLKLSRFKNHSIFNLRCKKLDLIPKSLRVPCRVHTREGRRIANRAGCAFVRERLHVTECRKRELLSDKRWMELALQRKFGCDIAESYGEFIGKKAERVFLATRTIQKAKLEALIEERLSRNQMTKGTDPRCQPTGQERWVVNLSKKKLNEDELRVLNKGLNFAPTRRNVPVIDVVASVECALKNTRDVGLEEEARRKIAGIIRRFNGNGKSVQPNVSVEENRALNCLMKDDDIVILPADKGNATVVMDKADYTAKALTLLEDQPFQSVKRDPKKKIEDRLNKYLWKLFQQGRMLKPLYNQLHASACPLPRFYGLAKTHKPDVPLRPVISAVGSALYGVSKYLAMVLKPLLGQSDLTIKNSQEFVRVVSDECVADNESMVSFDVKSLYTSLPIGRTLDVVRERLRLDETLDCRTPLNADELVGLLEICLTSTYFVFQERYYRLSDGVAMGSPVSSVVANIFMEHVEETALVTAKELKPRIWRRYVDDVFSVLKRVHVAAFLNHLNQVDEQINFTIEEEENSRLPFMDVNVERLESGCLRTSVFRKQTHTNRVLNYRSNHAESAKIAVARALMARLDTHFTPSDVDGRKQELDNILGVLKANDYPDHFVERVSWRRERPCDRIETETETRDENWVSVPYVKGMSEAMSNVLRPLGIRVAHRASPWKWTVCSGIKDRTPQCERKGVVYQIPCKDCASVYVGETLRNLKVRLSEHRRHTEGCVVGRSAVADHAVECDHRIDWDGAIVLDVEQAWRTRKIKEALHIAQQGSERPLMNKDNGWYISNIWRDQLL